MIIAGFFASVIIARGFKKAILGLEPYEIAKLFQERNAILESIREGVIAINEEGEVTMINQAALSILNPPNTENIHGNTLGESVSERMIKEVLKTGEPNQDIEADLGAVRVVINILPIYHQNRQIGAVASFRRRDDVYRMAKELSRVKDYSNMLRAQTHEFSNKLHTIAGLIQIEAHHEALELITKEASGYQKFYKLINNIVSDPMISAIIIGKYNYACEHDIAMEIDPDSMMKDIPEAISREKLVTVLGNLFDNAFDAVTYKCTGQRQVSLFMTDIGKDLIFEIEDSGCGIIQSAAEEIFTKGFSTKASSGRGLGLHIVKAQMAELNGTISVSDSNLGGALFTIAVPKYKRSRI